MFEQLVDGLKWMELTVSGRVEDCVRAVLDHDLERAARVVAGDSRINAANDRLQDLAFRRISTPGLAQPERDFLRVAVFVSQNMERIGDCAVSIAKRARELPPGCIGEPISTLLEESIPAMREGINRAMSACLTKRLDRARRAMQYETRLDRMFAQGMDLLRERSRNPETAAQVAALTLVLKYVEKVGDAVQNLAEQAILLVTGQRLKYGGLVHLERMLGRLDESDSSPTFRNLFEGHSGATVGQVRVEGRAPLVFKHDRPDKIASEIERADAWNRLVPGIVPRIHNRGRVGEHESFLAEFLESRLLQDILLDVDAELIKRALRRLFATLQVVWARSAHFEAPPVNYVAQIRERLPDLFHMHPFLERLRGETLLIHGAPARSLLDTLDALESRAQDLAPRVTVWTHGDLNPDNVFYDPARDHIHFIDTHRSGWGDYLQDVSVFMVGNVRNPMYPELVVKRMVEVNAGVRDFAAAFAESVGDAAFSARLMLARGRSLITSARLMADKRFARRLFLQGMRLLDTVARDK